jgi:hypothetical protein
MLGEATLEVSGTFAGEAIRVPIQIAALYPSIATSTNSGRPPDEAPRIMASPGWPEDSAPKMA